ncbi:hypothetical protein ZWY2020_036840 [Hordeum vulgare]|nr:hypothetical protein ZWY2020_036840 [Hordeum vulgare]
MKARPSMDAPSSPWMEDRPESHAVRKLSGAPEQYQAQGRRRSILGLPPPRPKIIHAHPSEFRELVQRLTGRKSVPSEAQTQDFRVDDALQGQSFLPPAAASMPMPEGIISENDRFEQAGLAAVAGDYRRSILPPLPPAAASWQFSPPTPKSAEQLRDDVQSQTKKRIQKLHTEAPVCALVDAMFRLPSKLDRLLVSYGHMLPRGAEDEIPLIKQDLDKMVAILQEHDDLGAEGPSLMVKCLTKEVRELSYDMEDSVDQYVRG